MSNNDKDIYDLLNEAEFDITNEIEIPMNDIQKQKVKKAIRKNIKNKKGFSGKKKIAAAIIALSIVMAAISPTGQNVIAAIKDKLFFNPGLGLVTTDEQVYILNEPITVLNGDEQILVKSAISKKDYVEVGIWMDDKTKGDWSKEDFLDEKDTIKDSIYIKISNGEVIKYGMYSIAGGGPNKFIQLSFGTPEMMKEFTLVVNNKEIEINLINAQERDSYNEVGGNSTDNELLVGGNMYTYQDGTYVAFWTNEEVKQNGAFYVGYRKDNIKVMDENGNKYKLEPSQYDGLGKEYYVGKDVKGPLNISMSQVEAEYNLKNPVKLQIDIPKKGETVEVNKEIYVKELDEKVLLKSIKNTDEGIEIYFDTEKYEKENTDIIMLNNGRRGWGIGASPDDKTVIMGIHHEDLSLSEKLLNKVNLEIVRVMLLRYGEWQFTVE